MKFSTNFVQFAFHRRHLIMASMACAIICNAQVSIAEQLEYIIYDGQDFESGLQLYQDITDRDIAQMPDSVLFNYHYLGGYINSEIPNHHKAIEHLILAKSLCDTRLGTYSIPYMEIMWALGNEYMDIAEYEQALYIFQEGVVKSMAIRKYAGQAFSNLIMGVKMCYERLGYYTEIPGHLLDAWAYWNKDVDPLETLSYYPLWELEQFYKRYELYDDALAVSDKIIQFVKTRGGENHPELATVYYWRGNILSDMGRKEEAALIYSTGLKILKMNSINDYETLINLQGNLITTNASLGKISECESLMVEIRTYCERIGDMGFYKNSLFTMSQELNALRRYDEALRFNSILLGMNLTPEEAPIVKRQYDEIQYNKNVTEAFGNLTARHSSLPKGSPEWFENAHHLSSAYNLKQDINNNLIILEDMYSAIKNNPEVGHDYMLWVLNNLMALSSEVGKHEEALKYAIKRKGFIYSLAEASEADKIESINQVIIMKLRGNIIDQIDSDWAAVGDFYSVTYGEVSVQNAIYLHNLGRTRQLQGRYEDAKKYLHDSINLQNRLYGKPMGKTVKYLMEVEQQLSDELI